MKTRLKDAAAFGAALAVALGLWACQSERSAGTEVENEAKSGYIYYADGRPAAGATVRVIPINFIPRSQGLLKRMFSQADSSLTFTTDAEGRYPLSGVPAGRYNILGSKEDLSTYRDSISLGLAALPALSDTLSPSGSVVGTVVLQPNHDPRTALVQLLGTDYFANVDADGRFAFSAIPSGTYSVRATTTLPDYNALITTFQVRSGATDSLSKPLELPFTGIPVVTGLKASLDTLSGVVTLTWDPVNYRGFLGYSVYRDPAGAHDFAREPLGTRRITGTSYRDTLYHPREFSPFRPEAWEYRVRVRALNGDLGDVYLPVRLLAVPPSEVRTALQIRLLDGNGGEVSVGDTVRVTVAYANPTFAVRRLSWNLDGASPPLRQVEPGKNRGTDTLLWIVPGKVSRWSLNVETLDERGREFRASLVVPVLRVFPTAEAGEGGTIGVGESLTLKGKAGDRFDPTPQMAWDLGGTGNFQPAPDGAITFTTRSRPGLGFPCVFRVINADGLQALDTLFINILPSRPFLPVPSLDLQEGELPSLALLNGQIHVLGSSHGQGHIPFQAWDSLGRKWVSKPSLVLGNAYTNHFPLLAWQGKLYAFSGDTSIGVRVFDPQPGSWTKQTQIPTPRSDFAVAAAGSQILVFGGWNSLRRGNLSIVEGFDPENGSWRAFPNMKDIRGGFRVVGLENRFYAMGGRWHAGPENRMDIYHPIHGAISGMAMLNTRAHHASVAYAGRIWVFGGDDENSVESYDPVTNTWRREWRLIRSYESLTGALVGDKVLLMGLGRGRKELVAEEYDLRAALEAPFVK